MKKLLFLILAFGLILCLAACGGTSTDYKTTEPELKEVHQNAPTKEPPVTLSEQTEPQKVYEYDTLQNIFMAITEDTTVEELWGLISESDLFVTEQEYNGGKAVFRIAYTEGAARQKYADSGDYINVTFAVLGENFMSNENRLMTAEYVNSSVLAALFYVYGTWYDFCEDKVSEYSGYYIVDYFSKEDGITIKYQNGYEKTTNYFYYDSAEEVIQTMIDGER